MQPRQRIKDMYEKMNAPDSDDEDVGNNPNSYNFDLSAAIKEKLE